MTFTRHAFDPSTGLKDATKYPEPESGTELREQLQDLHDQTKNALNGLMTELEGTDSGTSGADSIGSNVDGLTATTVKGQIEELKGLITGGAVIGELIENNTITTAMVKDDAITNAKLADDAVDSVQIADGAIDAAHLSIGAVIEAKIGTGAVTVNKIGNGAVTETKIGTGAVTADKIGAEAVTETKIGNGAVTKAKLAAAALAWTAIVTDQTLPASGASVLIAHANAFANYSEVLIQIKGDVGTISNCASAVIPLSSGITNPSLGVEITYHESNSTARFRRVYITATNVNILLATVSEVRYLSVFAR